MAAPACLECAAVGGVHQRDCGLGRMTGHGVGLKNAMSPKERKDKVTENDIVAALRARYLRETNGMAKRWAFVGQVSLRFQQRADAFAFDCWRSGNGARHAFEVKCTRADLRHELANPEKRSQALAYSTHFYFVLDQSVKWDDLEIPIECGVMIHTDTRLRIVRPAERRATDTPPYEFLTSAMRTIQRNP